MPHPQFSLKAILVIIAALGGLLGMAVSGHPDFVHLVGFLVLPVLLACIGHLLRG